MKKGISLTIRMILMIVALAIVFGIIFGVRQLELRKENKIRELLKQRVPVVSAVEVASADWQQTLTSIGATRAVMGVDVTTESAGIVKKIYFVGGSDVKKGQTLVVLNNEPDIAKLRSLQAEAILARKTYMRDVRQFKIGAVSKKQLESDEYSYKSAVALTKEQQALVNEKIIRAPFSGRIGIVLINLGQYLRQGDQIANLQALDPIFVDFNLPQNQLSNIHVGETVNIVVNDLSKNSYSGKVSSINPEINKSTRTFTAEAKLANKSKSLLPGMFVTGDFIIGAPKKYLTIPRNAVAFSSFGSFVYLLSQSNQKSNGKILWKVTQVFVKTGSSRGNQIQILSGVKEGDYIISSGQLKVTNNAMVMINNSVQPSDNPNPKIINH